MDRYSNFILIGKGASGYTYSAIEKLTQRKVAIKKLPKSRNTQINVFQEAYILQLLSTNCSDYVLCYVGYVEDAQNYYILTEYLEGYINLYDYTKNGGELSDDIIEGLLKGLQKIHQYGIAHRDIKPENIMINPNTQQIKYIDFGFACNFASCPSQSLIKGTLFFIAPEVILSEISPSVDAFQKADLWSLGLLILGLFCKYDILDRLTQNVPSEQLANYIAGIYINWNQNKDPIIGTSIQLCQVPEDVERILLVLLERNPSNRKLLFLNE